jgi:tRNA 2-thiouridine synthesizing protein A
VTTMETIDCRGMQCPEPILRLATAARKLSGAGHLLVQADDDAFPLDVKSWCNSSGAVLEELANEGGSYTARIHVRGKAPAKALPKAPGAVSKTAIPGQLAVPAPTRRNETASWGEDAPPARRRRRSTAGDAMPRAHTPARQGSQERAAHRDPIGRPCIRARLQELVQVHRRDALEFRAAGRRLDGAGAPEGRSECARLRSRGLVDRRAQPGAGDEAGHAPPARHRRVDAIRRGESARDTHARGVRPRRRARSLASSSTSRASTTRWTSSGVSAPSAPWQRA